MNSIETLATFFGWCTVIVESEDRRSRRPEYNSEHRRPSAPLDTLRREVGAAAARGIICRQKARYLLIAALSLCFIPQMSQALRAQDLVWAKRAGGENAVGIAVDSAGNSYVTGVFRDSTTFGAGESNETTLTSAGFGDIFVATHDASGDLVWAKRAGGPSSDVGVGIAVDGSGNSYVTGRFGGRATFGAGEKPPWLGALTRSMWPSMMPPSSRPGLGQAG